MDTNNPQIIENALALSDANEEDVELLGEKEFESLVSSWQAKQWVNSLIGTPRNQPKSTRKPKSSPKCGTTGPCSTS